MKYFIKFHEKNPSNVYGKFHEIPWNSMKLISMEFHGIPWNSMKLRLNSWNFMKFGFDRVKLNTKLYTKESD
jgi:hypothetical protein